MSELQEIYAARDAYKKTGVLPSLRGVERLDLWRHCFEEFPEAWEQIVVAECSNAANKSFGGFAQSQEETQGGTEEQNEAWMRTIAMLAVVMLRNFDPEYWLSVGGSEAHKWKDRLEQVLPKMAVAWFKEAEKFAVLEPFMKAMEDKSVTMYGGYPTSIKVTLEEIARRRGK